ncbi:hypothetical protein D3C86_1212380 [compost metagenome]
MLTCNAFPSANPVQQQFQATERVHKARAGINHDDFPVFSGVGPGDGVGAAVAAAISRPRPGGRSRIHGGERTGCAVPAGIRRRRDRSPRCLRDGVECGLGLLGCVGLHRGTAVLRIAPACLAHGRAVRALCGRAGGAAVPERRPGGAPCAVFGLYLCADGGDGQGHLPAAQTHPDGGRGALSAAGGPCAGRVARLAHICLRHGGGNAHVAAAAIGLGPVFHCLRVGHRAGAVFGAAAPDPDLPVGKNAGSADVRQPDPGVLAPQHPG